MPLSNAEVCRRYGLRHPLRKKKSMALYMNKWRGMFMYVLQLYKSSEPCSDCGRQFPHWIMQFDHARGKKKWCIAQAIMRGPAFQEELDKCDLVCANCHAERTWKRRQASK